VLVVKVNSACDGLDEGEPGGLGLDSLELLPNGLGDILGSERVLRLNVREGSVGLGFHSLVLARASGGSRRGSSSTSHSLVLLPQGVDTINHLLDQLNLGVSEPVLVGDVVGVSGLATRLSASSTGLQVQLLTASLQPLNTGLVSPGGKVNVDGSPHASTKVGGARVDVTILFVQAEVLARLLLDTFLDTLNSLGQPGEDLLDITSLLH